MSHPPRKFNRRVFVLSALLTGAVGWLQWPRLDAFRRRALHGPRHPLLGLLEDPAHGVAVGREYLRLCGDDGGLGALPARIVPGVDAAALPGPELRQALREQIRDDFANDRVIELKGWLLARCEARLFALCALWQAL